MTELGERLGVIMKLFKSFVVFIGIDESLRELDDDVLVRSVVVVVVAIVDVADVVVMSIGCPCVIVLSFASSIFSKKEKINSNKTLVICFNSKKNFNSCNSNIKGSEHFINGRKFAGELHMVHQSKNDSNRFAVLGFLIEVYFLKLISITLSFINLKIANK